MKYILSLFFPSIPLNRKTYRVIPVPAATRGKVLVGVTLAILSGACTPPKYLFPLSDADSGHVEFDQTYFNEEIQEKLKSLRETDKKNWTAEDRQIFETREQKIRDVRTSWLRDRTSEEVCDSMRRVRNLRTDESSNTLVNFHIRELARRQLLTERERKAAASGMLYLGGSKESLLCAWGPPAYVNLVKFDGNSPTVISRVPIDYIVEKENLLKEWVYVLSEKNLAYHERVQAARKRGTVTPSNTTYILTTGGRIHALTVMYKKNRSLIGRGKNGDDVITEENILGKGGASNGKGAVFNLTNGQLLFFPLDYCRPLMGPLGDCPQL